VLVLFVRGDGRHGSVLPFLPFPTFPEEKVHFMRFTNSYAAAVAAAVAAVVFSAAFQPVQAAPILIDNFTTGITGTTATGTSSFVSANLSTSGSFGVFDSRDSLGRSIQSTPRGSRTTSVGVFNSGTGTVLLSNNGAGAGSLSGNEAEIAYSSPTLVNLTTGGNDGFQITTGAVSNNLSSMSAYVWVNDPNGTYYYTLPSKSFWTSFTTYNVPFSDFPGIDFTQVGIIGVGMSPQPDSEGSTSVPVAGNVAYSSSATFTEISVVPEPTQLGLVAGVGAALGMWRLRKLRRNGEAAGDAIAS
jgi:hypothetical protein